jgi:hypothetical protein
LGDHPEVGGQLEGYRLRLALLSQAIQIVETTTALPNGWWSMSFTEEEQG